MSRIVINSQGMGDVLLSPQTLTHDLEMMPPSGATFVMTATGAVQLTFAKADRAKVNEWFNTVADGIEKVCTAADNERAAGPVARTRAQLRADADAKIKGNTPQVTSSATSTVPATSSTSGNTIPTQGGATTPPATGSTSSSTSGNSPPATGGKGST